MWQKVIACKYHYNQDCLLPNSNTRGRFSWMWSSIVKSYEKDDLFGVCLRNNLKIQIGDGKSIRFWFDNWIAEAPLRFKFPRIFVVCSSKQGTVGEFEHKDNGMWSWDIPLRRQLFDWEVDQWNSLLTLLSGCRTSNFDADWIRWEGVGDGKYSVKSMVSKVTGNSSSGGDWKTLVWRGLAPPKVEVFTWLVIRQRIPVRTELLYRDFSTINNILCPLCGLVPESVSHLLFNCSVAWVVWMRCAAFWGVNFVVPGDPGSFLFSWHEASVSSSADSIWHFVPFAIIWTIWLLRNDIIFADSQLDSAQLSFLVRTRIAFWFKAEFPDSLCFVDDLIADPSVGDGLSASKRWFSKQQVWEAPPFGFLKLNVDGAMVSNGSKGGIGGIVCNNLGVCLDTFSLPIGPGPLVMAELEAIFHGLSIFSSNHGFKKFRLILETDCSVAFEWISNSTPCPTVFEPLVRRCRDIIASFSVVFRHIPREINLAADSLAKEGIG
ncbi:hypothetical protein V6N11_061977 [Hibiscus sabdariffa]|uniref:Uncharacterized protein n=2 Tax=Hibiscus sabdariffa TaxID=183260 RepID=A0ABR2PRJ0_9ROSI